MNTPIRIALEAMLYEFGQTYLPGSSHAVDLARDALASPSPSAAPGYVDCGECPLVSTGCKGRCMKCLSPRSEE